MANNGLTKKWLLPAQNEKGLVLAVTVMIVSVLLILVGATLFSTRTEIQITGNHRGSMQALHAAEAGAEKVYDAFQKGDTNADGVVTGADTPNAANDLDNDGTIDFAQIFFNGADLGSDANRIEVNNGTTRAFIWVDALAAPNFVSIHSRGNPAGTNHQREVTLFVTTAGSGISFGALNNST